jgi:predicted aldo/keto reductase-like oxidoreductase
VQRRPLGRTGIQVGEIGLGTEHLHGVPRDTVASVVREAVDSGVSYFDILWPYPEYLDSLGAALQGLRDRVTLAVHIGCVMDGAQPHRSRDSAECRTSFHDRLSRLGTDHADVVLIHHVDTEDDYREVVGLGGLLELALRLRDEGKGRFIGLSSHTVPVASEAVRSGAFDVLMFPTNPAFDSLSGEVAVESLWDAFGHSARPVAGERRRLYELCAARGVGLVAMKPFAGGRFFDEGTRRAGDLSPVQLLSYALSQPGVSVVAPGVKNTAELRATLEYLSAADDGKDFGRALTGSAWIAAGTCVYCNHCLPCPSGIDIGRTLRLAAAAEQGVSPDMRAEYAALPARASDCIECGECAERCPFGVEVVERIRGAARLLEC